jgi:hypothetical protein
MAKWRNPNAGLFNGYYEPCWDSLESGGGPKRRRIPRNDYPNLYRLHRIGVELGLQRPLTLAEKLGVRPLGQRAHTSG